MQASVDSLSPAPRRKLYGRSGGKGLRAGQQRLLVEALPRVAVAPETLKSGPLFAFEPRELWLETGFGAGKRLIAEARAHPDIGIIGCEPFLNGVVAALSGIARENLVNVRIRRGDVQTLLENAPEAFFSRVFMLYPDPWPKRRHNKRRVMSEPIIEALARTMKPGGELRFATDIDDYAGWTLRRMLASPSFRWAATRADDWRTPWPEWGPTRYEAKARRAGRGSVYLSFVRL
jgi:tRNA (guanine-N7-)-methyltransferase